MLQVADTSVGAVGVQRRPLGVLTTHLRAEFTARSAEVDTFGLFVDRRKGDVVFADRFAQSHPVRAFDLRIDQPTFGKLAQDTQDTSGTVAFLNTVLLGVRCQFAEARDSA